MTGGREEGGGRGGGGADNKNKSLNKECGENRRDPLSTWR